MTNNEKQILMKITSLRAKARQLESDLISAKRHIEVLEKSFKDLIFILANDSNYQITLKKEPIKL